MNSWPLNVQLLWSCLRCFTWDFQLSAGFFGFHIKTLKRYISLLKWLAIMQLMSKSCNQLIVNLAFDNRQLKSISHIPISFIRILWTNAHSVFSHSPAAALCRSDGDGSSSTPEKYCFYYIAMPFEWHIQCWTQMATICTRRLQCNKMITGRLLISGWAKKCRYLKFGNISHPDHRLIAFTLTIIM